MWDSRATDKHYSINDWLKRREFWEVKSKIPAFREPLGCDFTSSIHEKLCNDERYVCDASLLRKSKSQKWGNNLLMACQTMGFAMTLKINFFHYQFSFSLYVFD